jgi:hypothetical protein
MARSHARALVLASPVLAVGLVLGHPAVATGPTLMLDPVSYFSACDGSAAVALSPDTFIVAHDDDNFLRGYKVGTKTPIFTEPLEAALGGKKEADIEGAARVDDVIYWIGSHGRNSAGEFKPNRLAFFATRVTTSGGKTSVKLEGQPNKNLQAALLPLLASQGFPKAAEVAAEAEGGLNIEGLAAADGGLLIGFRNPLPGGKALVVELTNPADLVKRTSAKPVLGRVFKLDLDGRGIRSLELISKEKGYLLVAGPTDDGATFDKTKGMFALYRWPALTGAPAPVRVDGLTFPPDFGPESLFLMPSAGASAATWSLLSDDGDRETGGVRCKDLPEPSRHFKRATLTLD